MDQRASVISIVLLCLACSGLGFQEKAPAQHSLIPGQSRTDKQQVLEDPIGSGRGIDESILKTIGKGGIKLVVASGSTTTTPKPPVQHQHHYYYPAEDQQHGRQYGYGYGYNHPHPPNYQPWPVYPQPAPPPPPPVQPPQRPWGPPPPPPPYYQWYGGQYGNYGGYYENYYPGYSGYPGYPYYPYYRASSNAQPGDGGSGPGEIVPPPTAGFQARFLSAPGTIIDGKVNQNVLPLYHLLNMSRP